MSKDGKKPRTSVEHGSDGSVTARTAAGAFKMNPDGSFDVDLQRIARVDIECITDVDSYTIKRSDGFESHAITFFDGGTVLLGYSDSGKLMQFELEKAGVSCSPDGVLTLRSSRRAAAIKGIKPIE